MVGMLVASVGPLRELEKERKFRSTSERIKPYVKNYYIAFCKFKQDVIFIFNQEQSKK